METCLSVRSLDGRFPSHTPDLHACLFVLKCPWPFRLCASSNGGLVVPLAAVTQTCVWFLFAGFVHPQGENSPTRSPRPQVGHLGELRTWQGKNVSDPPFSHRSPSGSPGCVGGAMRCGFRCLRQPWPDRLDRSSAAAEWRCSW